MSRIIYIIGPVNGIKNSNKPFFNKVASFIESVGLKVINPVNNPDFLNFDSYMDVSKALIRACDSVYLIRGTGVYFGINDQLAYARSINKDVIHGFTAFGGPQERKSLNE